MRTKELDVITSVANRIAHFEQKQSPVSDHTSTGGGGGYSQKSKSQRLTPSSFSSRYLDLDDIMEEESSIETEDSSGEDSGGYHMSSSEHTSSSPDTSFRLSPGSRSSSSRSDRDNIPPCSSGSISAPAKTNISEKLSQKSLDSGFSDYSDGKEAGGGGGGGDTVVTCDTRGDTITICDTRVRLRLCAAPGPGQPALRASRRLGSGRAAHFVPVKRKDLFKLLGLNEVSFQLIFHSKEAHLIGECVFSIQ